MSSDEPTEFTTRFRLTHADGRAALWFAAGEWAGWLVGLALLTVVCATWKKGLGGAGALAALLIPIAVVLKVLSLLNKMKKLVDRYDGRELVVSINREGLIVDTGLTKSLVRWPALRRIARGRAIWVFYGRNNDTPFFIPTAAIPVEARALVARWAGELGTRLT